MFSPRDQEVEAELEKRLGISFVQGTSGNVTNQASPPGSTVTGSHTKQNEKLQKQFDHQLKEYEKTLDTFEANMFMQAALIVFAAFMLFSKDDKFKVPVIDLELERNWFYFVVPLALLFLWLRFGFLLDSLIKTRIYGWELLRQMADHVTVVDLRSGAALFEDSGFVDGWFVCYREANEHLLNLESRGLVNFLFPAIFGFLLGANHACVVTVAHIGNARMNKDLAKRPMLRAILWALPAIMAGFILASHWLFYRGGKNPNKLELVIAGFAIVFMFAMVGFARARKEVKESQILSPDEGDVGAT